MEPIKLFLCGDMMTGRGIDQILEYSCEPEIHEGYLASALDYVALAEKLNGPIPRRVPSTYIWGDALAELGRAQPDLRIVNLETAVTTSRDWLPKGINYRMHPGNVDCIAAAAIDCCSLANNHVLDWGEAGLVDTLSALENAGILIAGGGRDAAAAQAPAVLPLVGRGRVLVAGVAVPSSGVPTEWTASRHRPGVNLLLDLSLRSAERLASRLLTIRQPGDLVVLSIHWGPNWGYEIPDDEIRFARYLLDAAAVDLVHGHSSHHPKAIEVYRDHLVLHGCGDFINDYEGIGGHEAFRPDLRPMYLATIEAGSGRLLSLELAPLTSRRFRLVRADARDAAWLSDVLNREGHRFGTGCAATSDGRIEVHWHSRAPIRRPALLGGPITGRA